MKLCYTLVLIFVEVLICFTIFRLFNRKRKNLSLAQKTGDLLLAAFFTVFPNMFIAYTSSEIMAMIFFSWYFCCIDVLLFFLLYFSADYAFPRKAAARKWTTAIFIFFKHDVPALFKKEKQITSWFEKIMLLLLLLILADIVSFVCNIFSRAVFTVEFFYNTKNLFFAGKYCRIVPTFIYDLHLSLSYLLVLLTFICLLQKTLIVPTLYKIKYFGVILLIGLIVGINSLYLLFELPVDFSVAFYGLVSVLIYIFSFSYIPLYLRRESISYALKYMNTGILIFDNDDQCIVVNEYIRKVYNISQEQNLEDAAHPMIQRISNGKPLKNIEPYEENIHVTTDGRDIYYRITFSHIENRRREFIGSYLLLVDTTEENKRERQERFRNTHDPLTGIYNKEHFYDKVAEALEANPDGEYFIICSDIGNFKLINEIYGATVGDKLLKLIALNLREKSVPGEVYGRIDNDRFAMLIPKERLNLQVFIDAADRIFKYSLDLSIMPTCYFGVYEIEDPDMRISFMCDRAFIAIDTIKGQYGKQVAWYDTKLRDNVLREQELIYQLSEAISTDQIKIYLQPQSTHDGKAMGAESLVRWEHPDEGLVSPAEFIPLFEKNGMITKIDRHVWHLVFKKLYEWKLAGHDDVYISVNISPKDFYLMNIYQEFSELLHEYAINPKNLHIEITEAVMMMDLDRQIKLIEELRALGFTIEIGDFGVGYSSLKILRECNIEILKLDINFLEKTETPRNAHIIMKQLITMAHDLGIKVLAKGIENKDQMDLMFADGCTLFQGYYFSRPISTELFEKIYL